MKVKTLIILPVFIAILCTTLINSSTNVFASSDVSADVTLSVSSSCVSYIDGAAGSTYDDVPPGSQVSLDITNQDSLVVQDVSGIGVPSGTQVQNNSETTNNETTVTLDSVTSPVTVTFTPELNSDTNDPVYTDNCPPTGPAPTSSAIVINPASANLSCEQQGSNWDIVGSFSGSSTGTGLYEGSTQVASISGAGAINQSVAAGTTPQTFTVLDGSNYGGKGTSLASVTCPSYNPASATTTPTPTTSTTPPLPPQSNGSSGTTKLYTAKVTNSKLANNLVKAGSIIVIIAGILIVLDVTSLWKAPRRVIGKVLRKVARPFRRNKYELREHKKD